MTGGGVDFLLQDANLFIDGPGGAEAIFRVPSDANFLVSNGNIIVSEALGLNSVVFFSNKADTDTHFAFQNTILNGVAFWDLGGNGGTINVSNSQGCTQLVGDVVDNDNVRFTRCAAGAVVPEPTTSGLMGLALLGLLLVLVRRPVPAAIPSR